MWKKKIEVALFSLTLHHSGCEALQIQMSGSGGWPALKQKSNQCIVGKALTEDAELRSKGN